MSHGDRLASGGDGAISAVGATGRLGAVVQGRGKGIEPRGWATRLGGSYIDSALGVSRTERE